MTELVLQDLRDGLLTITFNRPERSNAMTAELTSALLSAVRRAAEDTHVRAVLLRGAGGSFSVGGDIGAISDPGAPRPALEERISSVRGRMEASLLLHQMSKPVVAAVQRVAAGSALSIALACDLRVVGETAKITTAFAKVGLSGDHGGTYFLTKLLGSAKARELYLLSPVLSGKEAYEMGMMTRCVPDGDVLAAATDLAMQLAEGPTIALGYIKRNINNAETFGIGACFDGEASGHSRCRDTDDHREAAEAFMQRRTPEFGNR